MSMSNHDDSFELRRSHAAKSMSAILRKLFDLDPVLCSDLELWLDRYVPGLCVIKLPSDSDFNLVLTRRQCYDLVTTTLKGVLNHV